MTDKGRSSYGTCKGSESINGTVYAQTISVCGTYTFGRSWTLEAGRDCTTLTGVVGFVDSSSTNAEAVLTAYGDGSPFHTSSYTYGESRRLRLPIEDFLKVKLHFTSGSEFAQEYIAIGNGKVRCTL